MAKWPGYKVKCSVISFGRFSGHECYGHVFLVASKGATSGERVKTHKEGNLLRLTTSCCGTAIERLSSFTEFYLKPPAQSFPAFVKDTTDLLNKVQLLNESGPFPRGTLLVSWDVVAMFPNIDNNLGITAVKKALDSRTDKFPSTDCILQAVKICLEVNNCQFSDHNFVQKHGTAIGPKNACSYADLAMGIIDLKAKFGAQLKRCCSGVIRMTLLSFGHMAPLNLRSLQITLIRCIPRSSLNEFTPRKV